MKHLIYQILFFFISASAYSQANISVTQGNGIKLKVDPGVGEIQWQKSTDNINWLDVIGEDKDSLVTIVNANCFYRAIRGTGNCALVSQPISVSVNTRPNNNISATTSHTAVVSLLGCISIPPINGSDGYNQDTCSRTYNFTLYWNKGSNEGIIVTNKSNFIPQDGVAYTSSHPDVLYQSTGSTWEMGNLLGHYANKVVTKQLLVYSYNSNLIYSDVNVVEILVPPNNTWTQIGCDCRNY